jgi:thioredoxin-like negative regulator of GroEL
VLARVVVALGILLSLQGSHSSGQRSTQPSQVGPALNILFFTASWCEPCQAVRPVLEEFVRDNRDCAKLTTIDFDRAKLEVARWHVQEVPVVVVLSAKGTLLLRQDGASPESLAVLRPALDGLKKNLRKDGEKR